MAEERKRESRAGGTAFGKQPAGPGHPPKEVPVSQFSGHSSAVCAHVNGAAADPWAPVDRWIYSLPKFGVRLHLTDGTMKVVDLPDRDHEMADRRAVALRTCVDVVRAELFRFDHTDPAA